MSCGTCPWRILKGSVPAGSRPAQHGFDAHYSNVGNRVVASPDLPLSRIASGRDTRVERCRSVVLRTMGERHIGNDFDFRNLQYPQSRREAQLSRIACARNLPIAQPALRRHTIPLAVAFPLISLRQAIQPWWSLRVSISTASSRSRCQMEAASVRSHAPTTSTPWNAMIFLRNDVSRNCRPLRDCSVCCASSLPTAAVRRLS